MSSLTLSNDFMEGKHVSDLLCEFLGKEDLDEATSEALKEAVSFLNQFVDGLGFCLSEDGNLLSQWRGYARVVVERAKPTVNIDLRQET